MPYTQNQLESVSALFLTQRSMGLTEETCMADAIQVLREMERASVVRVCEYSGEVIEGEPFVVEVVRWRPIPTGRHATYRWRWHTQRWVERHYFADEDNAREFGCRECDRCGEWFMPDAVDDGVYVYGDWFCSFDCAHDAGWEECTHCGEWVQDYIWIDDCGCYCDETCAERDGWIRCERCDEWTNERDAYSVNVSGSEELWCESCNSNHAYYCDGCGEYFDEDEVSYDDESGNYLCDNCRDDGECCGSRHAEPEPARNQIRDLGQIQSWNWRPLEFVLFGSSEFRFGIEIETDSGGDKYEYARDLDSLAGFREHCWMKNDGSLCNGVEIVTHPMDLAYHWKLYEDGFYTSISDTANRHGFVSHNSGNCGLHIGLSRIALGKSQLAQDLAILKIMRLFQRFENQLLVFSRRRPADMERWASFKTNHDYSPKKSKVDIKTDGYGHDARGMFSKAEEFKEWETTKYRAVNICHRDHVEIRIFRGTLKWSTYFASIALVEGIAKVAKSRALEWIENVSWYDLIEEVIDNVSVDGPREMLREYLESKGLC